jgi:hypothetical protein
MNAKVLISRYSEHESTNFHRIYLPSDFDQAQKDLKFLQESDHCKTWDLVQIEIYKYGNKIEPLINQKVRYWYNGIKHVGIIKDKVCIPIASGTREYVPHDHYIVCCEDNKELHPISPLLLIEEIHE